jgi:hypothetical protein
MTRDVSVQIFGPSGSVSANQSYGSGSVSQRYGSADPDADPYQNVTDPEHWKVEYESGINLFNPFRIDHSIVQ